MNWTAQVVMLLALMLAPLHEAPVQLGAGAASRRDIDLYLVLAADTSNSMNREQLLMQREGYVTAFRDPSFAEAIATGEHGRIALLYMEWAGPDRQAVIIPWTMIASRGDALAVAEILIQKPLVRPIKGNPGTSISAAITYAAGLFPKTQAGDSRRVIDISGDGPNNAGGSVLAARDMALTGGITINGLPIGPGSQDTASDLVGHWLATYYEHCVIGGPGAFLVTASGPEQFGSAIRRKLLREIIVRAPLVQQASAVRRAPFDCASLAERQGR